MKSSLLLTVRANTGMGMIMEPMGRDEPLRTCPNVYGAVLKRAIKAIDRLPTWPRLAKCRCMSSSPSSSTANAQGISLVSQRLYFRRIIQTRFFHQSRSKISQEEKKKPLFYKLTQ